MENHTKIPGVSLSIANFTGLMLVLLIPSTIFAHESWFLNKVDKKANINIYYRIRDSGNVEFRGEMTLETSLQSCVAILQDADSMHRWVYNVKQANVLKKLNEFEAYSYVVNSVPFPLTERDSVIHTILQQDKKTLAVTILGSSVPTYIPEEEKYVRIIEVNSYWKFIPLDKRSTQIIFQGYGEPGGNISADIAHNRIFAWLSKAELWKLPYYTLKKMKTEIRKKKYQEAHFDFLKNR